MVNARSIEAGGVQNRNHLPRCRAQEVLIALGKAIDVETIDGPRQEGIGLHLRKYGLTENLVEGQAKNVRRQPIEVSDGAEAIEIPSRPQANVLAAFLYRRGSDAAIYHAKIIKFDIRRVAGTQPELATLRASRAAT